MKGSNTSNTKPFQAARNYGTGFKAGFAYGMNPGARVYVENIKNPFPDFNGGTFAQFSGALGNGHGLMLGNAVRVTKTFFKSIPTFGRWLSQKIAKPLTFAWRGVKYVATKIIKAGRVVGVFCKALAKEAKNLFLDIAGKWKNTIKGTKQIYQLKKERWKTRHGGQEPSAGTKARMGYDSFYSAKYDAKKDMLENAKSKTMQFRRDFGKKTFKAVGTTLNKFADAALLLGGIGGAVYAASSSKEDKE